MRKFFIILSLLSISMFISAQQISHQFVNVSMSDALRYLSSVSSKYTINFIYDELEDFHVTTNVYNKSIPDAIRQVIGFYPISMKVKEQTTDEQGGVLPDAIYVECTQKTAHKYQGRIVDGDGEAVAYANIRVLNVKDSSYVNGGVTNESGYFAIPCEQHPALLKISYIGYQTLYLHPQSYDLGTLRLHASANNLKEVTVKGSTFTRKSDRIVVIPDKQQVRHSYTGYDLLSQMLIPGVEVNTETGTITSVFGNVSVYVDSVKAEYRDVKNLRPKDIARVEYIDMPTGKFAREKAVINFITRPQTTGGYVSMDAMENVGYRKGEGNVAAKWKHKNTEYTFYGGASYADAKSHGIDEEQYDISDKTVRKQTDVQLSKEKTNTEYMQVGIRHITDKRTLLGKWGLTRAGTPENTDRSSIIYDNGMPINTLNRKSERGLQPSMTLYGDFALTPKQQLDAQLISSYSYNKYDRNYHEGNYLYQTNVKENLLSLSLESNYYVQLNHHNQIGAYLTTSFNATNDHYAGTKTYWNHFWTSENIMALHYEQSWTDKFMLLGKIGIDYQTFRNYGEKRWQYVKPWGFCQMSYKANEKHHFGVFLSKGNLTMNMQLVNKVDQVMDSMMTQRGNPELKESDFMLSDFSYTFTTPKFQLNAGIGWEGILNLAKCYFFTEGNKVIMSFINDGIYHDWQAQLSASYKPTSNLRLRASASYDYYQITGVYAHNLGALSLSARVIYYLGDFGFNLSAKTVTQQLDMENNDSYLRTPASYSFSTNWKHGNWYIEVGVKSPFTGRKCTYSNAVNGIYRDISRMYEKSNQASACIKVAYTFDFGRKTSHDKEDIDTNIRNAIMK
jgi:hypothetical protein